MQFKSVQSNQDLHTWQEAQTLSDTTHLGHVIAVEPSLQESAASEEQRFEHENINFGLIAKWIEDCAEKHTDGCKPGIPSPTETLQVIDCTKREYINLDKPKVVALKEGREYAALSYVWGDVEDDFPQVVKDSIEVVTKLNCQYLWVDRHCILQDDDESKKQRQIERMDEIYSQAVFTIVDAAGEDSTYGLAGVTHPRNPHPVLRYAHVPDAKFTYLGTPPAEKIRSSRWASRGWTFQEGILSHRRLFFTDEQVMFQCNNMSCLESFEIPMSVLHRIDEPSKKRTARLTDTEPLRSDPNDIGGHLMEFSKRNLTHDSDILKAFLGILNYSRKDNKYFHLRGSPISIHKKGVHLINAWYHIEPGVRNVNFPSWSWTGWKGEIKTTSRDNPDYDLRLFESKTTSRESLDDELRSFKPEHSISLDDYKRQCSINPPPKMEPVIELRGLMTNMSFQLIKWDSEPVEPDKGDNKTTMRDGAWAILPKATDITYHSFLYLDNEALAGIRQFQLPVMILQSGRKSPKANIVILVLREKSDRFERVGMVILRRGDDKEAKAKLTMQRDKSGKWEEPAPIPKLQEFTWWGKLKHESILLQ
ncbi:hypothetical protein FIE12Z_1234 [Fusarium flagelliforme]|uniref:Heterokaryon incompatibility domain-containing protein n=1 Tax=Fusarium flagelliforme TaxID=2675880 RepID=A0A395N2V0_9HYPO|nr:hypothetical protein FIE12Z_1234 [Fusarium flagelliforme]